MKQLEKYEKPQIKWIRVERNDLVVTSLNGSDGGDGDTLSGSDLGL